MELFRTYADIYKSFDDFPEDSREGTFFYRLDKLDTTTVYPILLEVVKRYNNPDGRKELQQILVDIESFFVRRAVCGLTAKGYNKLVTEWVKDLHGADEFSAAAIRKYLQKQEAEISRWPTDEEFRKAWLDIEFYKRLGGKRRMILEALETALHTGKTEKIKIERKLTLEHLLPREWEEHWPLPLGDGGAEVEKRSQEREHLLHTVGNLTLLTKELNPSVSNGPWPKKLDAILKHSALNLNRSLPSTWNEEAIRARSDELFKIAIKVWPRP
jgi:hypothetical protein